MIKLDENKNKCFDFQCSLSSTVCNCQMKFETLQHSLIEIMPLNIVKFTEKIQQISDSKIQIQLNSDSAYSIKKYIYNKKQSVQTIYFFSLQFV